MREVPRGCAFHGGIKEGCTEEAVSGKMKANFLSDPHPSVSQNLVTWSRCEKKRGQGVKQRAGPGSLRWALCLTLSMS